LNGTVTKKPHCLPCHQRAQAHNSTLYHRQHSFFKSWICTGVKKNGLLCAYECDFGVNDIITIASTGLYFYYEEYVAVFSVLNPISSSVIIHPIVIRLRLREILTSEENTTDNTVLQMINASIFSTEVQNLFDAHPIIFMTI
jgi:hypothetical protein